MQKRMRKSSISTSMRKGVSKKAYPPAEQYRQAGNNKQGEVWCTQQLLYLSTALQMSLEWMGQKVETGWAPSVSKDQICDHVRNLDIHKSTGPNEIIPWVLRELTDKVASPHLIKFEKSWQLGEVPSDWKISRGNKMRKKII